MLPRHTPGSVWSVRPVRCVEIQMRKTRWSAVMSVIVGTTPSVLASPVYPQVGRMIHWFLLHYLYTDEGQKCRIHVHYTKKLVHSRFIVSVLAQYPCSFGYLVLVSWFKNSVSCHFRNKTTSVYATIPYKWAL